MSVMELQTAEFLTMVGAAMLAWFFGAWHAVAFVRRSQRWSQEFGVPAGTHPGARDMQLLKRFARIRADAGNEQGDHEREIRRHAVRLARGFGAFVMIAVVASLVELL